MKAFDFVVYPSIAKYSFSLKNAILSSLSLIFGFEHIFLLHLLLQPSTKKVSSFHGIGTLYCVTRTFSVKSTADSRQLIGTGVLFPVTHSTRPLQAAFGTAATPVSGETEKDLIIACSRVHSERTNLVSCQ